MELAVIHFILLGVISGLTKGSGVLPAGPLNGAVGESVMFNTTLTPSGKPLLTVSWNFGDKNIFTFSGVNIPAPEYEDRITFFDSTGSLDLRNLTLKDSGEYRVTITQSGEAAKSGRTRLDVYERISGASVTSSTKLPIEGNSLNVTCDAAGSVFSRQWMKDGSDLILDGNMTLHDNNTVLSFNSLNKKDTGEYSCKVSNPLSSDEAKYSMVVNYGPENVEIRGPNEIHLNEMLILNCSAESTPAATYIWIKNGTEIHNSAVFTKNYTELSDSGTYTCRATNHITGRTSSQDHGLTATDGRSGGVSPGAIAGIVIACLAVPAAAGGGYYVYKKTYPGGRRSS